MALKDKMQTGLFVLLYCLAVFILMNLLTLVFVGWPRSVSLKKNYNISISWWDAIHSQPTPTVLDWHRNHPPQ